MMKNLKSSFSSVVAFIGLFYGLFLPDHHRLNEKKNGDVNRQLKCSISEGFRFLKNASRILECYASVTYFLIFLRSGLL
jgi:hypothetical protein